LTRIAALSSTYEEQLTHQIQQAVDEAIAQNEIEIVHAFSLPIQSRALTLLLNIPLEEAKTWIDWGTHVFRSEDDPLDTSKANVLFDYIDKQIKKAAQNPGEDLYSKLLSLEYAGRNLTHEEIEGIMMLTFAGGRDTVINAVTNTIAYIAEHPAALVQMHADPKLLSKAVEELLRYFAPLTHMGRVTTQETNVCGHQVPADSRISLCWASANRDKAIFERPDEVILNRKVNPHLTFGFSHHKCLGAHQARQILKVLLRCLSEKIASIEILSHQDKFEQWGQIERKVGFENLVVRFNSKI